MYTCDTSADQKEMEFSLAAAKSFAALRVESGSNANSPDATPSPSDASVGGAAAGAGGAAAAAAGAAGSNAVSPTSSSQRQLVNDGLAGPPASAPGGGDSDGDAEMAAGGGSDAAASAGVLGDSTMAASPSLARASAQQSSARAPEHAGSEEAKPPEAEGGVAASLRSRSAPEVRTLRSNSQPSMELRARQVLWVRVWGSQCDACVAAPWEMARLWSLQDGRRWRAPRISVCIHCAGSFERDHCSGISGATCAARQPQCRV